VIDWLVGRAVRSRPTQAVVFAVLYTGNLRQRYRGERHGALSTHPKMDTSGSGMVR
jgi:hypothetical protein